MGDEILWSLHTSKAEQLEYKLTVIGITGMSEHSPRPVPKTGKARSWSGSEASSKSCSLVSLHSFYFSLKFYHEYKQALVLLSIESKGQTGFMSCPPYWCLSHAFLRVDWLVPESQISEILLFKTQRCLNISFLQPTWLLILFLVTPLRNN